MRAIFARNGNAAEKRIADFAVAPTRPVGKVFFAQGLEDNGRHASHDSRGWPFDAARFDRAGAAQASASHLWLPGDSLRHRALPTGRPDRHRHQLAPPRRQTWTGAGRRSSARRAAPLFVRRRAVRYGRWFVESALPVLAWSGACPQRQSRRGDRSWCRGYCTPEGRGGCGGHHGAARRSQSRAVGTHRYRLDRPRAKHSGKTITGRGLRHPGAAHVHRHSHCRATSARPSADRSVRRHWRRVHSGAARRGSHFFHDHDRLLRRAFHARALSRRQHRSVAQSLVSAECTRATRRRGRARAGGSERAGSLPVADRCGRGD